MEKNDRTVERLQRRYERLAAKLGKTGLVLVGTIRPRRMVSQSSTKKQLGPYYQWTFKEAGKTVTINLSSTQAKTFQRAIDSQRNVNKTLAEMRLISRQLLEATTQSVKRRKTTDESKENP